jgi:hypothetical protein
MGKCTAITRGGDRCKGVATDERGFCYMHHPDFANDRARAAKKGGKRGGRGRPSMEIQDVKSEVRRIIKALEDGTIDTKVGNAIFQGWSLMVRTLETERSIKETDELSAMVEQLWEEREHQRGHSQGGRRRAL